MPTSRAESATPPTASKNLLDYPNHLGLEDADREKAGQAPAQRPQPASPLREREDYFGLKDFVKSLPSEFITFACETEVADFLSLSYTK